MRRLILSMLALGLVLSGCSTEDAGPMPNVTTATAPGGSGGGGGSGGSGSTTTTAPPATTTPPPTTAATTTTTVPPVETGSRDDPLPAGAPVEVGNWQVMVLSSNRDATEAVLAENPFNDPPNPGDVFTTVLVAITYLGEESESPFLGLTFGAVGPSGGDYGLEDDCGVIPDSYPGFTDVFPGGTVVGNLCWAIPETEAGRLVLTAEAAFTFDTDRFFLEIPVEGMVFEAPPSLGIVTPGGLPGSRGNPIPAGQGASVGSWQIEVVGSTPDGTDAVLAANQFNDPPPEGRSYYLVRIRATNRSIETETPFAAMTFSAVGPSAVAYGFGDDCGVAPDAFPDLESVFAGESVEGNLCWSVTSEDAAALLVIATPSFSAESERVFFEIP